MEVAPDEVAPVGQVAERRPRGHVRKKDAPAILNDDRARELQRVIKGDDLGPCLARDRNQWPVFTSNPVQRRLRLGPPISAVFQQCTVQIREDDEAHKTPAQPHCRIDCRGHGLVQGNAVC